MASIQKRGNFWEVRYDIGPDPKTGRRRQKRKGGFRTKKEAEKYLIEVQSAINKNEYIEPDKLTVAEYLESWLGSYVKPNLSPTTVSGYTTNAQKHIIPYIGKMQLQKLKPIHIQNLYTELREHGRTDGKGGLSPKSILYVHRTLSKALRQAEELQLISRNPCKYVIPPKVPNYKAKTLTEEQVQEMLDKLKDEDIFIPVLLAVSLGLRRGEALGLTWDCISYENKTIEIKNNMTYDSQNVEVVFTDPKSEKSRRVVTCSDTIIEILKSHRKNQLEWRMKFGSDYYQSNFVCTRKDGTPFHPASFSKVFKRALERYNLPVVRFHDLRHTNATIMLKNNIPAKVASERLGHSTISITLDLYSHVMQELQEDAARKIEDSIFGQKKSNVSKL